jgi:predicted small secreted protein
MKLIKKLLLPLSLVLVLANLTACNTVQGAGEDLQSGGRAISSAAGQ